MGLDPRSPGSGPGPKAALNRLSHPGCPQTTFLFFIFFIYDRHTHREGEREAEPQAEGEAGSPCREPDVGLNPGSPGSGPGLKVARNL